MAKRGKKYNESRQKINGDAATDFNDAVKKTLESSFAKFDETVDVAVRLGVDPRHADQMVRGSVILPNGLGKTVKVLVFAKGEKETEAVDAGAEFVGNDDLIEKIKGGWFGFDKCVATPDMMGTVGKLGKLLGPRGLMPNAKTGTVTPDVAKAIALGADAIAIGHSAMMALNCNKDIPEANYPEEIGAEPGYCYHCHTGRCPVGVATQDPVLRQRLDPDEAAERVYNFLHTLTIEAQLFARACGKTHIHSLEPEDLAALTMEASAMAGVPLAGTNHTVGVEDYHHL